MPLTSDNGGDDRIGIHMTLFGISKQYLSPPYLPADSSTEPSRRNFTRHCDDRSLPGWPSQSAHGPSCRTYDPFILLETSFRDAILITRNLDSKAA